MRTHNQTTFNAQTHQSSVQAARIAPYFERSLDRWKLALLIPLFLLLLAGAVYRQRSWTSWIPQTPASSVANPSAANQNSEPTLPLPQEELVVQTEDALEPQTSIQSDAQSGTQSDAAVQQPIDRAYIAIQPLPLNLVKGQAPIMPVTLAQPAHGQSITQGQLSVLQGTASAGSTVIVNHGQSTGRRADGQTVYQTQTLGEVQTSADGRWQLSLPASFSPGDHQLSVTQIDRQNGMQTTFSPVEFMVLNAGQSAQAGLIPVINSPQTAARLSSSCAGSSAHRFSGTAMAGWVIQLLINEQPAGDTRVAFDKSWEIAIRQPLAAGSYIARTVLLSPGGEVAAESAPVAFVMYPCQ